MSSRLTARDFDQELLILFDAYVHGDLDRRAFLSRAQKFAKAGMAATAWLAALSPDFAAGQQVTPSDPRLKTERVSYPSPSGSGTVKGYLARPANAGARRLPAVLVIHENRGLNPHIEDIARRLALEGFMAFAPDALTPLGGYPGDEDKAREAFAKLDQAHALNDFLAAATWLRSRPDATGRLGAVGFCYGGGIVHQLAIRLPDLDAGVPFYGPALSKRAWLHQPQVGRPKMAKTVRTAGTTSAKSRTTRRKVAGDNPATKAETKKQAKKKAAGSAALLVEDEFNNLRWAHRAYDCVQNLLAPLNSRNVEEFLFEPSELTALMEVINAEMGRRIQTVEEAIQAARKVLH